MGERGEDGMNILEGHSTAFPKTKYEEDEAWRKKEGREEMAMKYRI